MRKAILVLAALATLVVVLFIYAQQSTPAWTAAELVTLRSLSLGSLPPLPPDPSNLVADDPNAAALGRKLFFDPRFSANGQVACATCHIPGLYFTDGKPLGQGVATVPRHTMSLIGSAYSPWYTWDGKADSLWAQAFGPLDNPAEHGGDRLNYARTLIEHYQDEYSAIFGPLPDLSDDPAYPAQASPAGSEEQKAAWNKLSSGDQEAITQVIVNMAKAIAAYERTILPQPARFDRYVASLDDRGKPQPDAGDEARLSGDELAGLRLFIGKAHCINCHNGPLLTNFEFHNTGVPAVPGLPLDHGRRNGIALLQASEFTCLGPYSSAAPDECGEIRFLDVASRTMDGSFRTPTLRNVAATGPYMHAGQFNNLHEVIEHYNDGGYALLGHNELAPLGLSAREVEQLDAFLGTLTGPLPVP